MGRCQLGGKGLKYGISLQKTATVEVEGMFIKATRIDGDTMKWRHLRKINYRIKPKDKGRT